MRSSFSIAIAIAGVALLSACANQATAPTPATAAAPVAKKAPQCWNGDIGAFQELGNKTTLSGVAVECKATSDGKAAQWMGVNAKH